MMDAREEGSGSSPNNNKVVVRSRYPLQQQTFPMKKSHQVWDRFIPNRSAMDFDYAHYAIMEAARKGAGKEKQVESSPSAYKKLLAETMNMNRTRILAFKSKPPTVETPFPEYYSSPVRRSKPLKPKRCIPQVSERTLDAPDILDDYYLNLLDWGSSNVLSIALGCTVYLWDASNSSASELVTIDEENGPITSVSWAPNGRDIAIGLNNSEVQLWDTASNRQLRTLQGMHELRVGSLNWNNRILTTGGGDGLIVNNDVRIRSHMVDTYRGHSREVCGLKWSSSGQQLASGGNDNRLHIWDQFVASTNSLTQWFHRLEDHTAAVKQSRTTLLQLRPLLGVLFRVTCLHLVAVQMTVA